MTLTARFAPSNVAVSIEAPSFNVSTGAPTAIARFIPQQLAVAFNAPTVKASTGLPIVREYSGDIDPYTGSYSVTPSSEAQVLLTRNLRMTDNVTIGAIPQNYGLITWNGATLTVS